MKYDLVERGMGLEYFHAAEDNQATRNQVFDIIEKHLADVAVDSIIVEKQRWQRNSTRMSSSTPRCWAPCCGDSPAVSFGRVCRVIVFTDSLPVSTSVRRSRKA